MRGHGQKARRLLKRAQRMAGSFHAPEVEPAFQRAHHHHLRADVAQRHAQQGRVAFVQPEKVKGHAGACAHAFLSGVHAFGRARGAGTVHLKDGGGAVPGFEKVREIFTDAAFFVAAQGRQVFRAETLAV